METLIIYKKPCEITRTSIPENASLGTKKNIPKPMQQKLQNTFINNYMIIYDYIYTYVQ